MYLVPQIISWFAILLVQLGEFSDDISNGNSDNSTSSVCTSAGLFIEYALDDVGTNSSTILRLFVHPHLLLFVSQLIILYYGAIVGTSADGTGEVLACSFQTLDYL